MLTAQQIVKLRAMRDQSVAHFDTTIRGRMETEPDCLEMLVRNLTAPPAVRTMQLKDMHPSVVALMLGIAAVDCLLRFEDTKEREATSDELCEGIIRHLELLGEEVFEKNYVKDGEIKASVFAIVGPNSAALNSEILQWLDANGFKRGT